VLLFNDNFGKNSFTVEFRNEWQRKQELSKPLPLRLLLHCLVKIASWYTDLQQEIKVVQSCLVTVRMLPLCSYVYTD